jgi:hypothetical protein
MRNGQERRKLKRAERGEPDEGMLLPDFTLLWLIEQRRQSIA